MGRDVDVAAGVTSDRGSPPPSDRSTAAATTTTRFAPPRWVGALLVASVAAHVVTEVRIGTLHDALWFCHPFALVLGLGVLLGRPRVAAVGAVFHIGMGVIGYALELLTARTTTVTSALEHAGAFALALWVARAWGVPRGTVRLALAGYVTLQVLAHFVTPPAFNVNLAFGAWEPLRVVYPRPWMSHAGNFVCAIGFLGTAAFVLRRSIAPPRSDIARS